LKEILSIVERAYHGTLEEQDDTALWFSHMMKNAGSDISVLLRGNATNYAVAGQDASGLRFGEAALSVPPEIAQDISAMIEKGIAVYAVREDLAHRGVPLSEVVSGVNLVGRADLAQLWDEHERIWHW
jgi:predicted peroxiredoxin